MKFIETCWSFFLLSFNIATELTLCRAVIEQMKKMQNEFTKSSHDNGRCHTCAEQASLPPAATRSHCRLAVQGPFVLLAGTGKGKMLSLLSPCSSFPSTHLHVSELDRHRKADLQCQSFKVSFCLPVGTAMSPSLNPTSAAFVLTLRCLHFIYRPCVYVTMLPEDRNRRRVHIRLNVLPTDDNKD